jgi:hypothetical protein
MCCRPGGAPWAGDRGGPSFPGHVAAGPALRPRLRSLYVRGMGGRNPDRLPILASVRVTPPGCTRRARCLSCGHDAPLRADALLDRWGGHTILDKAIHSLRCSPCGARDVGHILTRVGA